jgi:hypothetical protein
LNDEGRFGQLEELDKLFKESFPDIGCLRCENDEFYILPSTRQTIVSPDGLSAIATIPIMTVACTRCGHIEQHLIPTLRDAAKPIALDGSPAP